MEGDSFVKPAFSDSGEPAVKKGGSDLPEITMASGSGCFDCNICLDFVTEPVVTLCGHLYCWPCLYKWLSPALAAEVGGGDVPQRRQCPVCKAAISPDDVVPLYGRGRSDKKPHHGLDIPHRPAVQHRVAVMPQSSPNISSNVQGAEPHFQLHPLHRHHEQDHRYHSRAGEMEVLYPSSPLRHGLPHSTAGELLGGMVVAVLPWVLRGHMLPPGLEMHYQSLYQMTGLNPSSRLQRQHLAAERSLHQLWFFLLAFVVLCLFLF